MSELSNKFNALQRYSFLLDERQPAVIKTPDAYGNWLDSVDVAEFVEQQAARIKELEEAYKNQLSMTANAEKELQRSINDSVKRIVELEESLNSIHGIATHRIEQVALLQCDILELQKQNEALKAENERKDKVIQKLEREIHYMNPEERNG